MESQGGHTGWRDMTSSSPQISDFTGRYCPRAMETRCTKALGSGNGPNQDMVAQDQPRAHVGSCCTPWKWALITLALYLSDMEQEALRGGTGQSGCHREKCSPGSRNRGHSDNCLPDTPGATNSTCTCPRWRDAEKEREVVGAQTDGNGDQDLKLDPKHRG